MNKTNNITIVGGGSAGWMTAATLIHQFPNKTITLIESPNVPTVGVGESTIRGIRNWTNLLGINDEEFIKFTDASYKLSIRFTDFYKKDSGSFHYPFAQPYVQENMAAKNDWYFKKVLYPDTPVSDYADCLFPNMALVNQNKITTKPILPGFELTRDSAYHFDATKFGLWLRDNYAMPRGVRHIQAEVKDIILNDDGIESLVLDNGNSVTADLFIDCTGFKSILLGGALKEPFNSYEDMLPNNSAWATRVVYRDKRRQLEPWTDCTAIGNGWVWNIPLWSRIGTGYVYSDKFVSDADALEEFKEHLKSKGNKNVDELEFKNIKMRVGIHRRLWVKNVCAIGLSAGFIEPLESSGLFTVHEFLLMLVRSLQRDRVNQWDKDVFSAACVRQFREFSEFVAMHYALSHRDDTPYWRAVSNKEYSADMIDQKAPFHLGFTFFGLNKMRDFEFDNGGLHCIATGMNWFPTDLLSMQLGSNSFDVNQMRRSLDPHIRQMDMRKEFWNKSVQGEPDLYDYLKNTFYKE
jgi:flavin-dependent dehydrogenase